MSGNLLFSARLSHPALSLSRLGCETVNPGTEAAVFGAIRGRDRSPDQLKHLLFTHGHPDHIGSAAAIVRETGEDLHAPASDWTRLPLTQPLTDGEMLTIAGGFEVIHTPGHCAGQVALLWRPGRMLFAGDVCVNIMGLSDPIGSESLNEGRASQRKLASLSFDAAGFGHGKPIAPGASSHFRNKYGKNPEDLPQQRSAA